jgi:hypothetical protein
MAVAVAQHQWLNGSGSMAVAVAPVTTPAQVAVAQWQSENTPTFRTSSIPRSPSDSGRYLRKNIKKHRKIWENIEKKSKNRAKHRRILKKMGKTTRKSRFFRAKSRKKLEKFGKFLENLGKFWKNHGNFRKIEQIHRNFRKIMFLLKL